MSHADFFLDPVCPFCWITSRWLKEVEQVRDVEVTWKPMSLVFLNEDRDIPEDYREMLSTAMGPIRIVQAAAERDIASIDEVYTALGTAIHTEGRGFTNEVLADVIAANGWPADLIDVVEDDSFDAAIRKSHNEMIDLVGDDVGTPTINIDGNAFFGPVLSSIPRGDEAGNLWDGAQALASYPDFFELKRSRSGELDFS